MSIVILKSDNLQYNMYTGTLVPSIKQQQQEQTGGSAATMKSKPNEVVAEFFVSLLFVDTLLFWPYNLGVGVHFWLCSAGIHGGEHSCM